MPNASTIPWDRSTARVLTEYYGDHGQWARHYSTVRMTLGTFFVTASFGLLQLRWEKPETNVAIVAALICLFGIIVFLLFSRASFNSMNEQLRIVNAHRTASGLPTVGLYRWYTPSGLPLALAFVLLFAYVDYNWVTAPSLASNHISKIRDTLLSEMPIHAGLPGTIWAIASHRIDEPSNLVHFIVTETKSGRKYSVKIDLSTGDMVESEDFRARKVIQLSAIEVQRRLVQLGYDVGRLDGIIGPKTIAAITKFQRDRGLSPTGYLDEPTMMAFSNRATRELSSKLQ